MVSGLVSKYVSHLRTPVEMAHEVPTTQNMAVSNSSGLVSKVVFYPGCSVDGSNRCQGSSAQSVPNKERLSG